MCNKNSLSQRERERLCFCVCLYVGGHGCVTVRDWVINLSQEAEGGKRPTHVHSYLRRRLEARRDGRLGALTLAFLRNDSLHYALRYTPSFGCTFYPVPATSLSIACCLFCVELLPPQSRFNKLERDFSRFHVSSTFLKYCIVIC